MGLKAVLLVTSKSSNTAARSWSKSINFRYLLAGRHFKTVAIVNASLVKTIPYTSIYSTTIGVSSLRFHWDLNQWRRVRWSDVLHFFLSPKRKLRIIRKRGERYHQDCIQRNSTPKSAVYANSKRFHYWLAIGYNFKSNLVFYNSTAHNGKMDQPTYLSQIL